MRGELTIADLNRAFGWMMGDIDRNAQEAYDARRRVDIEAKAARAVAYVAGDMGWTPQLLRELAQFIESNPTIDPDEFHKIEVAGGEHVGSPLQALKYLFESDARWE